MDKIEFLLFLTVMMSLVTCTFLVYYIFQLKKLSRRRKDKASIAGQRERIENQIYDLQKIMLSDSDRLFDNTRLFFQNPEKDLALYDRVPNESFYEGLGINFKEVKVMDKTVFCLMPFHRKFDRLYDSIKISCEAADYRCQRSDLPYNPGNILKQIVQMIVQSQVIVAALDGKNPNVFYEVGLAHSIGKTVILLVNLSNLDDIPFDLQSERLLLYSNPNDLRTKLTHVLNNIHHVK